MMISLGFFTSLLVISSILQFYEVIPGIENDTIRFIMSQTIFIVLVMAALLISLECYMTSQITKVIYNQIETSQNAASITTITRPNTIAQKIAKKIKVYKEQDHIEKTTPELQEIYQGLKERILNLSPEIETKAKKLYMAFKIQNSNIVSVVFQKSQLKLILALPKGTLNDPYNHTRDVSNIGHWASGDYELTIKQNTDLDEIMPLIKQSYQKNK